MPEALASFIREVSSSSHPLEKNKMTKGQFNYIIALLVCLSGCSLVAANPCSSTVIGNVPNPEVCYKYYLCLLWVANERTCPDNEVFNPDKTACEPGNRDTCEIWSQTTTTPEPPSTITAEPSTTVQLSTTTVPATTTGNPHNPCHGLSHGERVPHPDCHRYYTCILHVPVPHTCNDDHVFDRSTASCVPGDPETCEIFATTASTAAPSTTTTTLATTVKPPSSLEEVCRGIFFGARAHPESVTLFVGCIREAPVVFQCHEDEFFHPEPINECMKLPATTTPEPTTVPTTTPPTTTTRVISTTLPPNLDTICKDIHNQYVEHPQTCALYVFCWEGYHQVMQCPEFKIFDVEIASCRAGNQQTCQFIDENTATATEPTPPPASTEETTTTTLEETTKFNPCADTPRGNVPNDNSCTTYFYCYSGNAFVRSCEDGHIFHREDLICVPGDQSTCTEV